MTKSRARVAQQAASISLAAAMRDDALLGRPFSAPTFWTWHAVAKMISGEPLDEREANLFRECTGRTQLPDGPVRSLHFLSGRRSGKDRFMSAVAIYRAALAANWKEILSAGEQGVVLLLGGDRKQARILRQYCAGLLQAPMLAAMVTRSTEERTEFSTGAVLEVATNDASLVRGRSAIAILGTESCFWVTDDKSASSDEEVVGAAEPSMAMIPDGGLLVMSSSVHKKRGYMHRMWKELHGNDEAEDVCWLSPSAVMNPSLPPKVVERAMKKDPHRPGLNTFRSGAMTSASSCQWTRWSPAPTSASGSVHLFPARTISHLPTLPAEQEKTHFRSALVIANRTASW
jgi:hypothetical protein